MSVGRKPVEEILGPLPGMTVEETRRYRQRMVEKWRRERPRPQEPSLAVSDENGCLHFPDDIPRAVWDVAPIARAFGWDVPRPTPETVHELIEALRHQRAAVRYAAARRLGQIGSSMAIEALAEALGDEHASVVRKAASEALRTIGGSTYAQSGCDMGCDDEASLVKILVELAPYLRRDFLPLAVEIAEKLKEPRARAEALSALVPHLPEEDRDEVAREALEAMLEVVEGG